MRAISPILQQRLNEQQQNKPLISKGLNQELINSANTVKPNAPKAKLVKEGLLQSFVTSIKDTKDDCDNFVKAVVTGKSNDNKLGRLNDLGLKIGAGLIATFLAATSKTKTQAIMRFIGGGVFLASMKVWPKVFINLPAKLIHGFDIDRKYISAQGDKKDHFLDNQFIPEVYPDDELRKIGKRTGIDFDSPNGKEKIQRKMQKTALQNRTLWMATAGFSTPLMTALFCDAVEPHIENAVIKHDTNKALKNAGIKIEPKKAANGANETAQQAEQEVKKAANTKIDLSNFINGIKVPKKDNVSVALDQIIEENKDKQLDDEFFKQVAKKFAKVVEMDSENSKDATLQGLHPVGLIEKLEEIRDAKSTFEVDDTVSKILGDYIESLKNVAIMAEEDGCEIFEDGKTIDASNIANEINIDAIKQNLGERPTILKLREVLKTIGIETGSKEEINITNKILTNAKFDNSKFLEYLKQYDSQVLLPIRARTKEYMKQVESLTGSIAESSSTREFKTTIKKLFSKVFPSGREQYSKLKQIKKSKDDEVTIEILQKFFSQLPIKDKDYQKALEEIFSESDSNIETAIKAYKEQENLLKLMEINPEIDLYKADELTKSILGDKNCGLANIVKTFIDAKQTDLNAIRSRILVCANFERRIKEGGDLAQQAKDPNWLAVARKFVYNGSLSERENNPGAVSGDYLASVKEALVGKNSDWSKEVGINKDIKDFATNFVYPNPRAIQKQNYFTANNFAGIVKNQATEIFNNKTWKKLFVPMAVVLAGVTLAVQPLFGNIKKEYSDVDGGNK